MSEILLGCWQFIIRNILIKLKIITYLFITGTVDVNGCILHAIHRVPFVLDWINLPGKTSDQLHTNVHIQSWLQGDVFVRLSFLTVTNPNQLCDVLLFVCSKMADETNLSSKLPVADKTRV